MINLPHLELGPADPDFDEAVITIGGREEDTITVACEGAGAIAQQIVLLVNAYRLAYPPGQHQAPYDPGPGQVAAP